MAERMEFIALLYQISPDAGADGSPAMVELICSPKNAFLATAKPPAVLSAAAVVLVASVVSVDVIAPPLIASAPTSILPKPDVIEPAFSAPTVARFAALVILACVAPVTVAAVPVVF
jgi:hypothetical protein